MFLSKHFVAALLLTIFSILYTQQPEGQVIVPLQRLSAQEMDDYIDNRSPEQLKELKSYLEEKVAKHKDKAYKKKMWLVFLTTASHAGWLSILYDFYKYSTKTQARQLEQLTEKLSLFQASGKEYPLASAAMCKSVSSQIEATQSLMKQNPLHPTRLLGKLLFLDWMVSLGWLYQDSPSDKRCKHYCLFLEKVNYKLSS